jgi:sugar phosphate permease
MMAIGAFEAGGVVGCVMGGVLADFLMKKVEQLSMVGSMCIHFISEFVVSTFEILC